MTPAANITAALDSATRAQRREGAAWYRTARHAAAELAAKHGVTTIEAAGVIAALSPRTSWDVNLRYADQFLATGTAPTLGMSKRAAARIVAGEHPDDVLKGPKTHAFFECIAHARTDAVCVDRHAIDVAFGQRHSDANRPALTPKRYAELADAYRTVASARGMRASQVQAITWCAWRARYGGTRA